MFVLTSTHIPRIRGKVVIRALTALYIRLPFYTMVEYSEYCFMHTLLHIAVVQLENVCIYY